MVIECKVGAKGTTVSARMPKALVERVDFVVRNSEPEAIRNRSTALQLALEAWLPSEETRLSNLGLLPKKAR